MMIHVGENDASERPAPLDMAETGRPLRGDETVAEVSRRYPETVEVLKRMGINHCCGGHLRLPEAAAAAGVTLDDVLRAVHAAARV